MLRLMEDAKRKKENKSKSLSLFSHRACCYRTLFKNLTHALCFKIHTKTQALFKTLECLRLSCHPTCFGHILDHLQGMFLVQCCFLPCCLVTILLGYVAISICAIVMYTSLLEVLLYMTTAQIDMATYPSKIMTKQQGSKQHCTRNIPWRWSSILTETCRVTQQMQTF